MPGEGRGCRGGEWGHREGDGDVAKPVRAHSYGESSASGPGRDPSGASVLDSWVRGGDAERGIAPSAASPYR